MPWYHYSYYILKKCVLAFIEYSSKIIVVISIGSSCTKEVYNKGEINNEKF